MSYEISGECMNIMGNEILSSDTKIIPHNYDKMDPWYRDIFKLAKIFFLMTQESIFTRQARESYRVKMRFLSYWSNKYFYYKMIAYSVSLFFFHRGEHYKSALEQSMIIHRRVYDKN